jgi:hypothetical protein
MNGWSGIHFRNVDFFTFVVWSLRSSLLNFTFLEAEVLVRYNTFVKEQVL